MRTWEDTAVRFQINIIQHHIISQPQVQPFANTSRWREVAFSPDGVYLAVTAGDGLVRLYVLPIDDLITLAQARVTRSLTDAECRQYLHLEQCEPDR
jgi:WD40 repeat protein